MKKQKKKIILIISTLILAVAVTISSVILVVAGKNGMLFKTSDGINRKVLSADLDICDLEIRAFSFDELYADSRITFDQSGMLVNLENTLNEDFEAEICEYKDTDVYMNKAITSDYAELSADIIEKFDEKMFVSSSYRTAEEQAAIIIEEGENATAVGASEHQTGLALDVYVRGYAGSGFIKSEVGRWVNSNSWKYGFVIRYPYYKTNVDGIGYEPWHIRYIGKPHAEIIYKNSLTLEEYFDELSEGKWYKFKEYRISRQSGSKLNLPNEFTSAVISPDNTGGYLITVII